MRLMSYNTGRDGDHDGRSRSSLHRRTSSPPSPSNATFDRLGHSEHESNRRSDTDQSRGEANQPYRLPPLASMRPTSPTLCNTLNQAARPQMQRSVGYATFADSDVTAIEDTDMANRESMRRGSQHEGQSLGTRASSRPHIYACNPDEIRLQSRSPVQPAEPASNIAPPYTRTPVSDLLNHPTTTGDEATGQTSAAANVTPSNESDHPMPTPPCSTSTLSDTSFSSISSDSTLRLPFSIHEERSFHTNTLYHICMDATSNYINSLLPSARRRHNQLPRHRNHSSRYQPYPTGRRSRIPGIATQRRTYTLMDNTRDISTYMWRRARSDGIAPHRAEADAVNAMRNLYAWSTVVTRGMESENMNFGQSEDDEALRDDHVAVNVARAAKNLCQWLGDEQAEHHCHGILHEMMTSTGMEVAGCRVSEIDEGTLDGSIA